MEYTRALEIIDRKMLECSCRAEISKSKSEDSRIGEEYQFLCCVRNAIELQISETCKKVGPGILRCTRCGHLIADNKYCTECGQRIKEES